MTRQFGGTARCCRASIYADPHPAICPPEANSEYSLLREDINLDDYMGMLSDACRYTM